MFGIIILLCIAVFFGFMLAWICGMVANEEIDVKTGVIIVVLSMIASIAASYGLQAAEMHGLIVFAGSTLTGWLCLSGLLVSYAKITWDKAMIVAAIYAAVQFAAFFLIGLMFAG